MADRLSAIFALFAVTWKITLKTTKNQGSKNGTQNHFSESSMTLFRYFVCIFPKKQEWTVCRRIWHLHQIAHLHAAKRYSVCQHDLTEETRKSWKVTQEKRCLKGSSKKADTQTNLPSRTNCFLPRKFRNAQN